ncbi:alpha-2-macroglobulin family protein [Bythopirellula goksoeyrii]|uniref:alpha-2-macroglobulin family protein n=1 Tax=Bythopirellula goksoeyrii TaxID=1400387 RepID=UPI00143D01C4|nr:MG2 domain-containing protein [Bythopirellula goksoeyrii]
MTRQFSTFDGGTAMKFWITVFFSLFILLPGRVDASMLESANKLYDEGNYQEALDAYKDLLASPTGANSKQLATSVQRTLDCYRRLNRQSEVDAFLDSVATAYVDDWQVLAAVADGVSALSHYGVMTAGEYVRGPQRGGQGQVVNSIDRDRVRSLQLYRQAFEILARQGDERSAPEAFSFLRTFAEALLQPASSGQSWGLQELTDLSQLPDYEEGWQHRTFSASGAPVTADGRPVYYEVPDSWKTATSDGERWRWILKQIVEWQPANENYVLLTRAKFLQSQFGVQTLSEYGWWFGRSQQAGDEKEETGTFALHTLGENETIARLATGIERFTLPDENNYIKLFEQVAAENARVENGPDLDSWTQAVTALANLFENRRQYPRAAEFWQQIADRNLPRRQEARDRLAQITGNWGRFEPVSSQPAGMGATVDFRFRNGKRVEFIAQRVEVRQLLDDVKAYLKKNPDKLDWEQLQIENIGHRLVTQDQKKYVGAEVARWSLDLSPREKHVDRRITVTTPLQDPGAYLLTSKMADGNTTSIVLWLKDTAIVKKPFEGKSLYYVADASTGKPIAKCNLEFFGYSQQHLDGNRFRIETKSFAEKTNSSGVATIDSNDANRRFQWLTTATTSQGRFAYLGFNNIWSGDSYDQEYQQVKVFSITDRPVYRPDQEVHFKFWVAQAQFDMPNESRFAAKSFQIEIRDPRNERVYSTQVISDLYGGLSGTWQIPEGATLGQYQVNVVNHGGGTFRVEEYKKPEYEVTVDAPDESVMLGETIKAKITAKYYFGKPVTDARVHYKVLRTSHTERWYPPSPWDWLYGAGYGWFGEDYSWYPGWQRWGCLPPSPWWFWRAPTPPEVVSDREVPIGVDGTVEVEIDTSLAQELHPNDDHKYEIQAEVVDQSRRTIVGNGSVLVAREPFQVTLWTDRGFYRTGDTITVGTAARTLDGKPVSGNGTVRLLKILYEDGKPVETEVGRWELDLGETGQAEMPIKASAAGQYRLSYELTDAQNHTGEGGRIFTIAGPDFNGSEFRYNDLEIVPDRRNYQPGDKAALQINTNQIGSAVLLFVRPANGVYQLPQLVKITGKSTVVEVDVVAKDTPNIYVEAVTVHGGRVHTFVKELFVPPTKRVLNLEVVPSSPVYLPGQEAKLSLKLTDVEGQPFVGSLALAVYDKALDYIAGGSNVADIRTFFWKWRRNHNSQGETNLRGYSTVLVKPDQPTMGNLGIFGESIVDEIQEGGTEQLSVRSKSRTPLMLGVQFEAMSMAAAPMPDSGGEYGDPILSKSADESAGEAPDLVEPTLRQNFADTAFWQATLETNAEGIAQVEFPMPENLTAWKIHAWGMGHGTQVGEGSAEVVTRKNLIVRLQAPRFFVETDEVVLSANVHNYLATEKQVRVSLELEGETITGPEDLQQTVTIPADGEQRVDWRVKVVREGEATIRMSARTDEESDAMQMSFPVLVHGMLKTESYTGVIRPQDTSGEFSVTVPSERRAEETRLEIRYTPTLAGAMVDALPYLLDYPYGCTEQTLNRFLPAVVTQQTLRQMNLDLAGIQAKRTNLNSQEIGDDLQRAAGWKRFERNPVFDDAELAKIVKAGVNRLTEMQLGDGGWGWFSGFGEQSTPHTTATVVHGLQIAVKNDVAMVPGVLDRGIAWLLNYQSEQVRLIENYEVQQKLPAEQRGKVRSKPHADNLDALVFMVLAEHPEIAAESSEAMAKMRDFLYRDRTKLAVYSLATYGIALQTRGETEKLAMVMRNIGQYLREDDENQTAWLELPGGSWWYWYGSEYEAHAYYLKLLVATDPDSEIAPRLVKYLLNNRKHATYWNSTRDTALVIEAFADYLQTTGETEPNVTLEVWIDGQERKSVTITKENLFTFDNKLVLLGEELAAGRHTVELRKQGESPIYYSGYLTNFTLEDDIKAAGLELKVDRQYYKLTPVEKKTTVAGGHGQVVQQAVEKYERTPLVNFAEVASGDLVEVELTVESKNDYEYILLEDMKAAGLEPVEVRSGYNGNELGAYVELRDERVNLFLSRLARGRHSVTYRLRAEIPGQFSALPTKASAMYAPELKANSDEMKIRVAD